MTASWIIGPADVLVVPPLGPTWHLAGSAHTPTNIRPCCCPPPPLSPTPPYQLDALQAQPTPLPASTVLCLFPVTLTANKGVWVECGCVTTLATLTVQTRASHVSRVTLQASMEPPFLLRHRVALAKWKPVLEALEDVMLQTSAMESVLEGQGECSCMPQQVQVTQMHSTWTSPFAAM